jgi:glutathione transport system permease protein
MSFALGRRLLQAAATLLAASVAIWGLLLLTPGDPAERVLQAQGVAEPSPERIELVRREMGLDDPPALRYARWFTAAIRGDLGTSYRSGQAVTYELGRRAGPTALLTVAASAFVLVTALPAAVIAARYANRWPDHVSRMLMLAGSSVPSFWIGMLAIDLFALRLGWVSVVSRPDLGHVWLPAATLGLGLTAGLARLIRAGILDEMGRRYVTTARARGAGAWRVLVRHALPNAAAPAIHAFALGVGSLLGGAAITEAVFTWPGVGQYVVAAIGARDIPVIQGFTLIMAGVFVTVNLCADFATMVLDPRVRTDGRA